MTRPLTDRYLMPKGGWVCYHCGQTFKKPGTASDHFGPRPESTPACLFQDNQALLMEFRKLEQQVMEMADIRERLEALEEQQDRKISTGTWSEEQDRYIWRT